MTIQSSSQTNVVHKLKSVLPDPTIPEPIFFINVQNIDPRSKIWKGILIGGGIGLGLGLGAGIAIGGILGGAIGGIITVLGGISGAIGGFIDWLGDLFD